MRIVILASALLADLVLMNGRPAFSQEPGILLTPAQTRIYHACLTADWIQDFCRSHAWGTSAAYDRTEAECVAANRGYVRFMDGRDLSGNTEAYCWDQAHSYPR